MFCFFLLFSSSRIRYPEAVKSFRCVKFVKSQVEIYGPSRRWASAFRLYRSNQTHTAAYMHNRLHAKTVRMVIFSGSYFENEWSLDLWSLVETCSAQENIACEASSMISVIFWHYDPMLRSSTNDAILFLVLIHGNTNDLTWIASRIW